jgi:signal transduction histidine kinase
VIGRNCRFLSGEQTSKEARSELRNAIDRGLSCTVDILNYRADGHTFWNRLTVFPVGGSERNPDYYVGYQVDVTKTKKMEEERELLSQEIQDSKKHESLGVMVAGVAHEINNPLGIALTATSHMIREANRLRLDLNTGDDKSLHKIADYLEDESEAFSLIQSNLERAAKLVRDFKGISADRVDVSRRKINLWQYTETLISSYLPTMKRSKVSIELTGTKQIESTLDTGAFGQVIANIITNSVTHAFANTADKKITVSLTEKDWKAEIEISDNGSGIPEGILHKIFDPFVTTKRGSGGTGLGLYIAKRIVNNELNGELHAFNKPEGGAVFRISFPLREVL